MGVEWKKTVPVFALVLLVALAGVVVAVATRRPKVTVSVDDLAGGSATPLSDGN